VNRDLRATWIAPNNRGSAITSYNVWVENKAGVTVEYVLCQGLDSICSIVLTDLLADYLLVEDDEIRVYVTATNIYGTSDQSIVDGVKLVQTVPHKP
jgi:hypothetical protein